MRWQRLPSTAFGAGALIVAGVAAYGIFVHSNPSRATALMPNVVRAVPPGEESAAAQLLGAELTVRVSPAECLALGIETVAAQADNRPEQIRMSATTALDSDSLVQVRPRFAGEVTEVLVRLGQKVTQGQPLAVIWSKDLGEKKSEYIDARSLFKMNQEVLNGLKDAYQMGAIPERTYQQAVRDLESARIARDRAYRTLISWRLTKEEIDKIDGEKDTDWPREIAEAPAAGQVVEKNVVPGILVDPSVILFQLADLSRIAIRAYAFEEDLPRLHVEQPWQVTLPALPGKIMDGQVSVVGAVVDPTQHTVTVQGTALNPGEVLKAGMFASATVNLPPPAGQVVVPTTALIDQDDRTYVYVQSDQRIDEFLRRLVRVKERLPAESYLTEGVHPGENVVTRGVLELDQKARVEDRH